MKSSEVECLHLVVQANRQIYIALEQPSQSWGFKMPFMVNLTAAAGLVLGLYWFMRWFQLVSYSMCLFNILLFSYCFQPFSYILFDQPRFVTLTWLAFFGADLQKPVHLLSNVDAFCELARTMTKADRKRFNESWTCSGMFFGVCVILFAYVQIIVSLFDHGCHLVSFGIFWPYLAKSITTVLRTDFKREINVGARQRFTTQSV